MKRNTFVAKLLFVLFATFSILFIFKQTSLIVNASSQEDVETNIAKINDGVTNWQPQTYSTTTNNVGQIPLGGNAYLDYTFGAARDSNNNVILNGADNTILTDSGTSGATSLYNSKINIFFSNNNKYYGILHQGTNSYKGGNPGNASDSSLDFALVTGVSSLNYSNYSILYRLKNKVYYTGTQNGKKVFKIGGFISNQNMYAEILLRPNLSGAPIVQRELYLYNSSGSQKKFQIYYGEDTDMDSTGSTSSDNVPIYAIGNNQGLYLYSNKTNPTNSSKLFVNNNVTDGFNNYMGEAFTSPYDWSSKGKPATGSAGTLTSPKLTFDKDDVDNIGDYSRAAGSPLLYGLFGGATVPIVNGSGEQDSAYALRWKPTTLDPGKTAHYSSALGAVLAGYAVPTVSKTYVNKTRNTGLNQVGDKLQFTLSLSIDGSSWNYNRLLDTLPTGLTLDPSSVKYVWTQKQSIGSGSDQHDVDVTKASGNVPASSINNNQIDYNSNTNVGDKGKYIVTFDATINNKAPLNLSAGGYLTNNADFTGHNVINNNGDVTKRASVNIPVQIPNFNYQFTNQIRNDTTDPNGAFSSSTSGSQGDIVEYKSVLTPSGIDYLKSGHFNNTLLNGIELIPDSVTVNGSKQGSLDFDISDITTYSPLTVDFKAKITSINESTVSNIATVTNAMSSSNTSQGTLTSDNAELNIKETIPTTSFVEVPTTIDFGSTVSTASDRLLNNIRTDGKLIINHSADTPFIVSVGYDNNVDPIESNGNKLITSDSDNAMMFDQSSDDGTSSWQPIVVSPGVSIKNGGFSGSYNNYDLSGYIGLNKWKLLVPANSKAGQYSGKVTWSIYDTPQ
ncbi:isopeptide-forming domain-containing fimbrial protein [Companilactobacillus zhachilii]|uniref:isopeptide-forming domain-containing fimbrial protein n=1 Tax=Companilactobacillus zhachilii TaxID=2304606 RepID=UPI004034E4EC